MNTSSFDWRLLIGLIFLFLILFSRSPQTDIIALALGAAWMLNAALLPWRGRGSTLSGTRVVYWRGERIVTRSSARARLRTLSPVLVLASLAYLALGLAMIYAALLRFLLLIRL